MYNCDVLVIGGGPAGTSAARASAATGARTILIEAKSDFGKNIACAEGIGEALLPYLPFSIPRNLLIWKIDGLEFYFEENKIVRTGPFWRGFAINRSSFDKWIASKAEKAGATLMTNSQLVEFVGDDAKKAIVEVNGKKIVIQAKSIVAADGGNSTCKRLLNLETPTRFAEVYSWEADNLEISNPRFEQIYFDTFSPGGYAYLFPKSKRRANIGVGGLVPVKKMKDYFYEFIEDKRIKLQLENANFLVKKEKKVAWGPPKKEVFFENIFLAGDAANHGLKPLMEGILPAVISGNLAGEKAALVSKKKYNVKRYSKDVQLRFSGIIEESEKWEHTFEKIITHPERKRHAMFVAFASGLIDLARSSEIEMMKDSDLVEMVLEEYEKIKSVKKKPKN